MDKKEKKICQEIWAKNKYLVLSKSQAIYKEIREHLKRDTISHDELKALINKALIIEENRGEVVNALQHVWGYFKKCADTAEKERFMLLLSRYEKGECHKEAVLNYLAVLLEKYPNEYLMNSSIFRLEEGV